MTGKVYTSGLYQNSMAKFDDNGPKAFIGYLGRPIMPPSWVMKVIESWGELLTRLRLAFAFKVAA